MAPPPTSTDPEVHRQEKERHMIYTTYYTFGSWYTHGSHRILQDFFEKGSTSKIPTINALADNDHEYKSALSGALVLGLKFAAHLEDFGFKVHIERLNKIASSIPELHKEGIDFPEPSNSETGKADPDK